MSHFNGHRAFPLDRIEKVADAIVRELRRQHDKSDDGLVFSINDDMSRVGLDGYVNVREIAFVALETVEVMK